MSSNNILLSFVFLTLTVLLMAMKYPNIEGNQYYLLRIIIFIPIAIVFYWRNYRFLSKLSLGLLMCLFLTPFFNHSKLLWNFIPSSLLLILFIGVWIYQFCETGKVIRKTIILTVLIAIYPIVITMQLAPLLSEVYSIPYLNTLQKTLVLIMGVLFFMIGFNSQFKWSKTSPSSILGTASN